MARWVGRKERILVERIRDGCARGYGEHYLPVELDADGLSENQLVPVNLTGMSPSDPPRLNACRSEAVIMT